MHIVEKYILELLYKKEILILPGVGTFVVVYSSSKIDVRKKIAYPPLKKIFFKNEFNNDNILVNYIAAAENISVSLAETMVKEYVGMLKAKLSEEKKYTIDNFCVFSLASKSNISFSQSKSLNLLNDAFGLSEISAVKIKRNFIGFKNKSIKGKIFICFIIAIIVLLPLIFLLNKFNYLDSNGKIKPQRAQVEKPILRQNNKTGKEIIKIENKEVKNNAKYFIVGGCFVMEENAKKLSDKIKKKGFNPEISKNKDGLFMVSYAKFDNKTDAVNELKKIKTQADSSAWLVCQ
ncbi:MAG: SPOR domain-containing protein [Bacteroidales bacterium]|jgi:hypothetical protein